VAERLHVFSFEEYTEIAARSSNRVEYWEGAILDMPGRTPRHSALCSNIGGILGDLGPKLDCYKTIASVKAVVLVAQDRVEVTVYTRQPDGSFLRSTHESGIIELASIGCRLPVAEIYEDLPQS
jgi:Uma2 family endonuclease